MAGLAPALLYVLLRDLKERGRSSRSDRENLTLTFLFAFGTVFFFTAVQGAVWFAAHVVACVLLPLYLLFAFDAKRPALAGLVLGLLFMRGWLRSRYRACTGTLIKRGKVRSNPGFRPVHYSLCGGRSRVL